MSNLGVAVTPQELFERFGMDGRKPLWSYDDSQADRCPICGKLIMVSKVEDITIRSCGCKKVIK
jgi:hypothetical protein